MIKVKIDRLDTKICLLEVSGHSNYDEHGKDIVCAGVSAIIVGGINSLLKYKQDITYECKEGYAKVLVNDIGDDNIQGILDVITTQLYTIQESYSKFIKINENRR